MAIHGSFAALISSARNKQIAYHLLNVLLDVNRLQSFLLETIPLYCPNDTDLILTSYDKYHSLYARLIDDRESSSGNSNTNHRRTSLGNKSMSSFNFKVCYDDLSDCLIVISTFLSANFIKPLPSIMLFEAHYLMGCIQETVKQTSHANQSYIKALWILAAVNTSITTQDIPTELLATTLHCLGRTYGDLNQHIQAKNLLQNAEQQYVSLNVHKDHTVMIEVRKLIAYQIQRIDEINNMDKLHHKLWSSSPALNRSSLTLIIEEDVDLDSTSIASLSPIRKHQIPPRRSKSSSFSRNKQTIPSFTSSFSL
jgi:hypothetical protein